MSIPETELPQAATAAAGLRRNLKLWQVVAVSIGVMAPSLAISLEPQGAVSTVGRAIPLTYLLALVGVLLVSYGFARRHH
jgi:amino acid transporter